MDQSGGTHPSHPPFDADRGSGLETPPPPSPPLPKLPQASVVDAWQGDIGFGPILWPTYKSTLSTNTDSSDHEAAGKAEPV